MADYLWRLAVVLPLILLAIVAVLLLLHRRRGGAFPAVMDGSGSGISGLFSSWRRPAKAPAVPDPLLLRMQPISPVARVVVLRFAGREHLVGVSGETMLLIASAPDHAGTLHLQTDDGEAVA